MAWGQPAARPAGQSNTNQPHIGYLYPGGGQQGSVILLTAGGQFLRGATDVYVEGSGVRASVIQYIKPLNNLQKEQRELLQRRLKEVRQKRLDELSTPGLLVTPSPLASGDAGAGEDTGEPRGQAKEETEVEEVKLPDHPLLYDLDNKSLRELEHIRSVLLFPRNKQQPNRQLAEMVLIEVTIDPNAEPGNRALRLGTSAGLTNPMVFQVGLLPEIRELEPNNRQAYPTLPNLSNVPNLPKEKPAYPEACPSGRPLELPVLLNGQIMPGDIDRFRFHANKGQQLVMEVQARSLIPYLADAVPGWFQAVLSLYDAKGNEVAFADDYRFNPDPVLFYKIPEDGEYELEIRDSIYRGREDFVYRIAVSEQPFITQILPLHLLVEDKSVGRSGIKTVASPAGWTLYETCPPYETLGRRAQLPQCNESENNDTTKEAQQIDLPNIINGRIDRPGDIDVFQFEGRGGDKIAAEVYARRLNSPLDSLLRLTDASGNVLEWNDDHVLETEHLYKDDPALIGLSSEGQTDSIVLPISAGVLTHHADSYLMAELPKDATYYVHLADSQHHGGEAYGYRLRIAPAEGDFTLFVTPSSLSLRAGGITPITVHALRKDGFDGEIEVTLKDATMISTKAEMRAGPPDRRKASPSGVRRVNFELNGGRIPAGCERIRMTLTAPPKAPEEPVALQLEGCARIGGQTVRHPAVPADDVMQAFLYRHLVPTQELLVLVQKTRWAMPAVVLGTPNGELAGHSPIRIPAGGSAAVLFKAGRRANFKDVQLALNEPPEGLTLYDVTVVPEGLAFRLKADKDKMQCGFADNLIVEAFRENVPKQKNGPPLVPAKGQALPAVQDSGQAGVAGKAGMIPAGQQIKNAVFRLGVLPAIPIEIVRGS